MASDLKHADLRLCALFLSLALFLGGVAVHAQEASVAPPPANSKASTDADFIAAADEVLSQMSEITGLKLRTPLKKSLRSREEIRTYVIKQMDEEKNPAERYASARGAEAFGLLPEGFDLDSFMVNVLTEQIEGLYDPKSHEFYIADWSPLSEQRMVMAHELGHIALGHRLDTKLAFNDRMFFPDQETFERMDFARSASDEDAADKKALELLTNSPYKDKLANAGLFLKALQERAPQLKHLIRPHLGNSLANGKSLRMSALLNSAPTLDVRKTDQIAALPLGGRIKLDPWSNHIELVKTKPVAILSPQEKMPFEVTPFFPYLIRLSSTGPDKVALTAPVK